MSVECEAEYVRADIAASLQAKIDARNAAIANVANYLRDRDAGVLRLGICDNNDSRQALHKLFALLPANA